jgi:hypothetical protein
MILFLKAKEASEKHKNTAYICLYVIKREKNRLKDSFVKKKTNKKLVEINFKIIMIDHLFDLF